MKQKYFLGAALLSVMCMNAQDQVEPFILPNWEIDAFSTDNVYAAGKNFTAKLYNLKTGEIFDAGALQFGSGNFLSDNGVMVGNMESGTAYVYMNGRSFMPETLSSYWFCYLNAITPDGTRTVGVMNHPDKTDNSDKYKGVDYIPFYCDIVNGVIGEPVILPYPTEDLVGGTIQFASAIYISADGKTILGVVNDRYGYYDYPIIYTQNSEGEWSYSLPTAHLFNPDHVDFPPNPWRDEPYFPEYVDFMSAVQRAAYEEAMAQVIVTGIVPDPFNYMTAQEQAEYIQAATAYNEWFDEREPEMKAYEKLYFDVLEHSYEFPLNELALSPDGTKFASTATRGVFGGPFDQLITTEYLIYINDLEKEEESFVSSTSDLIQPSQILDNGTVLAAYPINPGVSYTPTDSFIILPGSDEVISILDYWSETNPAYAEWVNANTDEGAGYVITTADMTIFAGSLDEWNYNPYGPNVFDDAFAAAYIFGVTPAGVETIVADSDDYKVYNLQGVNVMNTKDKNELNKLPQGIYIVNGKKYLFQSK